MSEIKLYNQDCLEAMRDMPDKAFELAIVDPPYGIGLSSNPFRQKQDKKNWDCYMPSKEYFKEIFRISKDQIIWGGNYFYLPPTQNYIVWDKKQPQSFSSAMGELAWCSIQRPLKIFRLHVVTAEKNKIHPTQKPVALYKWLLKNYAKPNDKILDTHLGSGSIAIACHDMGFSLTGYELDTDYFNAAKKRLLNHQKQGQLFI